jgi:hypothetical protein
MKFQSITILAYIVIPHFREPSSDHGLRIPPKTETFKAGEIVAIDWGNRH